MNEPEKLIYFPYANENGMYSFPKPEICWHSDTLADNNIYIHTAHDAKQAAEGRGTGRPRERIRPYSDELWLRCERFMRFHHSVREFALSAYNSLLKGKPSQLQIPLFDPYEIAVQALEEITGMKECGMETALELSMSRSKAIQLAEDALKLIGVK